MKVDILASGSGGNCIALRSSNTTILVDVGIAKTKIEKRLLDAGIRPDNINAIFITHAHSDHVKGLPLASKYHIPVHAAEGEWKSIKGVPEGLQVHLKVNERFYGNDYYAYVFETFHDAFAPVGYAFHLIGNEEHEFTKVSICLDTGKVTAETIHAMRESDIYIIEANHDPKMVEHSQYPNSVKARILSHVGHLSNQQTAEALSQLVTGKGEQIYLTHLSSSNNMPELAKMTVMRALAKKGFKTNKDYEIEVV